jgi:hypothetical protein
MEAIQNLFKYFNITLQRIKGYPEIYTITYKNSKYQLISNTRSQLLGLIKKDPDFKIDLIKQLSALFLLYFKFDEVYFSSHGSDIVINIVTRKLINLDIGIFATILSYLNQDEFNQILNNLLFKNIFESPVLWTELIRQKFSEYYLRNVSSYAWKDVFMGLLEYDQRLGSSQNLYYSSKNEIYRILSTEYPETKKYLIMNDLINIDSMYIDMLILNSDLNLVKHILEKVALDGEDIVSALYASLDGKHPDVLEYLLNYKYMNQNGEIVEVDFDALAGSLVDFILDADYTLELSEFKVLQNKMNPEGDIHELIHFALDLFNLTEETVDYIRDKLPEPLESNTVLLSYLKQAIEYTRVQMFELLYNKYKKYLTDDIKELINTIHRYKDNDPYHVDEYNRMLNYILRK